MLQIQKSRWKVWFILPWAFVIVGCQWERSGQAQPQAPGDEQNQLPLVDVAVAAPSSTPSTLAYSGTTAPTQTVVVRSRSAGQLLRLTADVGDTVAQGALIAQLDNAVQRLDISEAQSELAARQFEVEQAKAELAAVQTQVEQAKAAWEQAKVDAERYKSLAADGVVSLQTAELADTERRTTEQVYKAATAQVQAQARAVDAANRRVNVQAALIAQSLERSDDTRLNAPIAGVVMTRAVEAGDFMQPGQPILEIGNLSQIQVTIQVSDRDLAQFRVGQSVQVTLDALPGRTITGQITTISPVTDPAARLVPVEIAIANPGGGIGSGLLARVTVNTPDRGRLRIPETALNWSADGNQGTVFVPRTETAETVVEARPVQVGQRNNGEVEILSGLEPGEAFVVRSDRPLNGGETVQRSFLSQ
ncbi:efflux RND transporter periplasmic adaptor subunit [Spirulina major CS-329]|uniref:efflux RND transporter periplasmic adaptor subunit n=1 Tax=Spirulina TaxID=1154 RepID=UPI00232BD16A|nr:MULTISPECIES: efflux RND transporter periplasmic adaptor subunit [Spirulina]MDB9496995.1 efflux RND transporter periplasmic adaptor subunit [Spirulina subsalsa CS-330]MDB9501458.1 efflux RND transporter periplasmic adaptor subunit [Spirulina major CS-329]